MKISGITVGKLISLLATYDSNLLVYTIDCFGDQTDMIQINLEAGSIVIGN